MHIAQLLHPLALTPHIEIVETMLPDVLRVSAKEVLLEASAPLGQSPQYPPREPLFDRLHDPGRIILLRFADQQMNVLRHDYIADHDEAIALPNLFEDAQEKITAPCVAQPGLAMVATASDEVEMLGAVVALEAGRHTFNLAWKEKIRCDANCIGPHLCKRRKGGPPACALDNAFALIEGHPPPHESELCYCIIYG